MHILADVDAANLRENLRGRIPQVLLNTLARTGIHGLTKSAAVSVIMQLCPSTVPQEALREQTLASLAWFRFHGDIHMNTYRYHMMPPYSVVLDMDESDSEGILALLCGDPRLDSLISAQLKTKGIEVSNIDVDWESRQVEINGKVAVGWRRQVLLCAEDLQEYSENLNQHQIPTVLISEIGRQLPDISGLVVPPYSACTIPPPMSGHWMEYARERTRDSGWRTVDSWQDISMGLLRWHNVGDECRQSDFRYFFHRGREQLAELSQSSAALWQFRLDRDFGTSKEIWVKDKEIWFPNDLPDPHRQWIQLQANWVRWQSERPYALLSLPAANVAGQIARTLGLKLIPHHPN